MTRKSSLVRLAAGILGGSASPLAGRTPPLRLLSWLLIAALAGSSLTYTALAGRGAARKTPQLEQAVAELRSQLGELRQEREMPARVLNRHSGSICYIYGAYSEPLRGRRLLVSGSGFVVADGWIATNRHVVEPLYDELRRHPGAGARLERLVAFFPGLPGGIELTRVQVARDADLAVAHFDADALRRMATRSLPPGLSAIAGPLPLASRDPEPGDAVLVVGYPMGLDGMLAKAPQPVYRRLAFAATDLDVARQLAALSLIRPSATQGHLGDVVGDRLLYDAATASGGSGGPIFNARGEVIGVNSAYLYGFSGGTLGISARALRPLLEKAKQPQINTDQR